MIRYDLIVRASPYIDTMRTWEFRLRIRQDRIPIEKVWGIIQFTDIDGSPR